jgi:hypothetical protein
MVVLHTSDGIFALPYKDGSVSPDIQRLVVLNLVKGCRAAGKFEGLVMVAEAWMAKVTNEALIGVLRAAQDPDREEVVIACAYGQDGDKQMVTAPIVRADGKVSLGERKIQMAEVESWLDEAFKEE